MKYQIMWLFVFGSVALVPFLLLKSGLTVENVVISAVILVTVTVFIVAFLRAPRRKQAEDCHNGNDHDKSPRS
ncbi:MAG: hypothetical protein N2Z74_08035 [Syntrophales bacterium]|nr:hypothetical protein [Syntrophales bacterium]